MVKTTGQLRKIRKTAAIAAARRYEHSWFGKRIAIIYMVRIPNKNVY